MSRDELAKSKISIPHNANAEDMMRFSVEMHRKAAEQQEAMRELMGNMVKTPVDNEMVKQAIEMVYPLPTSKRNVQARKDESKESLLKRIEKADKDYDREWARMKERQTLSVQMYQRYLDTRGGANTAYGLFGALIDVAQHRPGRGDDVYSQLYGERQKETTRAFKAVNEIMTSGRAQKLTVAVK